MVPEPTEAMGAKLIDALDDYGLEFSELWRDLDAEGQIAQAQAWLVEAFAAAPPEYLLRVALSEEELGMLSSAIEGWYKVREDNPAHQLLAKLSRALNGEQET